MMLLRALGARMTRLRMAPADWKELEVEDGVCCARWVRETVGWRERCTRI